MKYCRIVSARDWRVTMAATQFSGMEVAQIDHLDGLTVDLGEWWFNLRPSNTEPLLRLNVEASDRETMERERDRLLGLIRQ